MPPNEFRIHVARRGEQVTVPSRRPVVDGGSLEAEAAMSPTGSPRDNLKSNSAGKKESIVCMAIQTVAAVKTELRNRHGKCIIAPCCRRVK